MTNQLSPDDINFLNSIFDMVRDHKPLALESLLQQGVPADLTNAKGDTLLILAAYHEHQDIVELLVKHGANLNALNDRGQTPLVCAVFRQNEEIARYLLEAGADPHLGHQSPLEVARFFGIPAMETLLEDYL